MKFTGVRCWVPKQFSQNCIQQKYIDEFSNFIQLNQLIEFSRSRVLDLTERNTDGMCGLLQCVVHHNGCGTSINAVEETGGQSEEDRRKRRGGSLIRQI